MCGRMDRAHFLNRPRQVYCVEVFQEKKEYLDNYFKSLSPIHFVRIQLSYFLGNEFL